MKKILLLVLMTLSTGLLAKGVFLESVTGTSMGASEKEAINEFLNSAVQNLSGYDIADESGSADIVLRPKLLKVSDTYFLKVTRVENGRAVRSLRMKSKKLTDIDRVTERLVTSILRGGDIEESATLGNITEAEKNKNTVRYEVTRQWVFGFGPTWLNSSDISKSGILWKFGYEWGLEPNFSLNLGFDGTSFSDSSADFSMITIGGDYFFNEQKTSPYVGGAVGYGSADAHGCSDSWWDYSCEGDYEANGWAAAIDVGVKFFRTSSVNVGLEAEYAYIFDETKFGNPSRWSISLAVYY